MSNLRGRRVAIFGGVYNNHLSLAATMEQARTAGAEALYCLGDMGGFGPNPDKVFPYLRDDPTVFVMQGNYDHSIGNRLDDCACGYTDPRDNHFAQISYDYTLAKTSDTHKDWLRDLPASYRLDWAGRRVLLAHGSPRQVNEFLWESMCPDVFLEHMLDKAEADVLFVTHTGIPWMRRLDSGKLVVNVGAIGRPPNDGDTRVDYALVDIFDDHLDVHFEKVAYDHELLAAEMREEGLPAEFVETILTGYWTTCLEILPAKERSRGRY
jgi:diadenosine tetraphosphatase ApaH/serine/threonine PP2A family protein phosphatase